MPTRTPKPEELQPAKTEPTIDWDPAPGYLLCKPLKREEVAKLYDREGASNLQLPDRVGKVSDSVGVAQVISKGGPDVDALVQGRNLDDKTDESATSAKEVNYRATMVYRIQPGDYVAFMPFTDLLIEIDGHKYSLVGYDKVRAVRKGGDDAKR